MFFYTARPGGRRYRPVVDRLAVPMSGALAFFGSAGLALGLGGVGELRPCWFSLGVFAVGGALLGRLSRPMAAPVIGLVGWLFYNGYVVHRYAVLGWAGGGVELGRMGLLTCVALVGAWSATRPRRRIRTEQWALQSLHRGRNGRERLEG
ncbi:hypothetical protein [Kitasatospora kifunensis]|uniref:Integral membrane protein n=1 Tax=Kitasatospora kifunensis TaxID=58351 RepID=A0A7W7VX17_KITKI|nr:hypothetical protein [Kitasatospora kifunensis]MBB4925155.1 hypothetical protein [Kitasatospora kifunensis]